MFLSPTLWSALMFELFSIDMKLSASLWRQDQQEFPVHFCIQDLRCSGKHPMSPTTGLQVACPPRKPCAKATCCVASKLLYSTVKEQSFAQLNWTEPVKGWGPVGWHRCWSVPWEHTGGCCQHRKQSSQPLHSERGIGWRLLSVCLISRVVGCLGSFLC